MTLTEREQEAILKLRIHNEAMRENAKRYGWRFEEKRDNEVLLELIERLIRENDELKKLRLPA